MADSSSDTSVYTNFGCQSLTLVLPHDVCSGMAPRVIGSVHSVELQNRKPSRFVSLFAEEYPTPNTMGNVWEEHNTKRGRVSDRDPFTARRRLNERKLKCFSIERWLGNPVSMRLDPTSQSLLAGRLTGADIPPAGSSLIRVFISSTGYDSDVERSAFLERVYPRLREYCREQYGLEFQVVDLAWGLRPGVSATDRNLPAMKTREIVKCQTQSAGPSFVAFVGQKYGPRHLPVCILAEEYEVIRVALHAHRGRETRNAPLLDRWYVIDNNAVPPVYVIKNPADVIPGFSSEDTALREAAVARWSEVQREMGALLVKGAELGYLDGVLDGDARHKYHMSELENEIQLGIENCDHPHKRCVLILRDIVDLKNYIEDPSAAKYTEVTYNERTERLEVPAETENQLKRLKNRAQGLISPANTLSHEVLWKYDDVISPILHKDYLHAMCEELYGALKRLVDDTAPETLSGEALPHAVEEAAQHWTRCRDLNLDFHGREDLLQLMRDYVTGYSDRPLVVYGQAGTGKTKLISKLALELSGLVPGNLLSLTRYVGYTPKSSDLRQLLLGLCTQVSVSLGYSPDDIPTDFKDLQRFFPELLIAVPVDTTVVIILDAVDQLSPDYNAHFMSWVPVLLPSHVKIILTTLPDTHMILPRLREEILPDPACFMEIPLLPAHEAEELLLYFLQSVRRCITECQMEVFRQWFTNGASPLYVKLLAEEAKTLHSFSDAQSLQLAADADEAIGRLFGRLEAKHGRLLVSRAMCYMVASRSGLSDCEMEDLLSLDDRVLNEVFRQHHPTLRRIPSLRWLQVREDISSFLTSRLSDGVTVTVWEHARFETAVRERYLSDAADVTSVHSMLADYFLGTWAARAKPVEGAQADCACQGECRCARPLEQAMDRKVPTQPLTFSEGSNEKEVRFNKRKYDQVPLHLHLSGRQTELDTLVLFNYEWLYNKIKALSLQHIMADFALNPSYEAELVQKALHVAEPTIEKDINNLPAEITGRLLPYYATHAHIRALIRQCDTDGLKHCALLPNFPYQEVPGSSLQYTLDCPMVGDYFGFVFEERYLVSKKTDQNTVHVFDLLTGELKDTIFASVGELHVTPSGNHFILVDHVTEKTFKIHDSGSGAFLGQIIVLNHLGIKADTYRAGPISLTDERLCGVVTTDTSFLCIAEIPSGEMLQIVGLDGKATTCQLTPCGNYVFTNSNEFILSYNVYTLEHICTVPVGHKPSAIAFTADGLRAFLSSPREAKLMVMHLQGGQVDMTYKIGLEEVLSDDVIRSLKVAPNDEHVLLRSDHHILVHERAQEKLVAHFTIPDEVPKEFRLPKNPYKDLVFTNATFSPDSKLVIATIFRNVYLWRIATRELLTSIQAPIGIIETMLVSNKRKQLVTHLQQSREVHVWSLDSAVRKVDILDKLTDSVQHVQLTQDNSLAYVMCRDSDEIGVIDMRTGALLDLLTHDTKVRDLAITPSGHMALVATVPRLSGTAAKLWDLTERRVVQEMGQTTGFCVSTHCTNSILYFSQPQALFHAPYDLSIIHFIGDTHSVHETPAACKYVRAKPFLTYDDRYVVVSSALDYHQKAGVFVSPCLVVFDLSGGMKRTCYDAGSVGLEGVLEDIVSIEPCRYQESSVAVLVSCRSRAPAEETQMMNGDLHSHRSLPPSACSSSPGPSPSTCRQTGVSRSSSSSGSGNYKAAPEPPAQIGFFMLDVRQGCITSMCVPFLQPAPDSPFPPRLVFSSDFSLCLDAASTLYELVDCGAPLAQVPGPGWPPEVLALQGTAAVYYKGSQLYLVRLRDGRLLARCQVHAPVCLLSLCSDQRTLLVGCQDGTVASYVLLDPESDVPPTEVLRSVRSRAVDEPEELDGRHSRSWDKVEVASCPPYSRPPSAQASATKDKMILRQIQPVNRFRPKSDTLLYLNAKKSQACSVIPALEEEGERA